MEAQLQEVSRRVGHPGPCARASQGGAFGGRRPFAVALALCHSVGASLVVLTVPLTSCLALFSPRSAPWCSRMHCHDALGQ